MNICGARTRGGWPCKRVAGWGSAHLGSGRCSYHGGKSTGPKNQLGNKNALKHGRYEYMYFDSMSKAELGLVRNIIPDALEGVQSAYILACIRERRMTQRITELRTGGGEFVLVEGSKEKGSYVNGAVDLQTEVRRRPVADEIIRLERALMRLAGHKAKVIEKLHTLHNPERQRMLDELIAAIERSLCAKVTEQKEKMQ